MNFPCFCVTIRWEISQKYLIFLGCFLVLKTQARERMLDLESDKNATFLVIELPKENFLHFDTQFVYCFRPRGNSFDLQSYSLEIFEIIGKSHFSCEIIDVEMSFSLLKFPWHFLLRSLNLNLEVSMREKKCWTSTSNQSLMNVSLLIF